MELFSRTFKVFIIFSLVFSILFTVYAAEQTNYEYQYDSNNRLIKIFQNSSLLIEFFYDSNGNVIKKIRQDLEAPTDLQASSITQTGFTLSWTSVPNAIKYKVYQNGVFLEESMNTTYQVSGLRSGTTYTLAVSAVYSTGEGDVSPPLSVSTLLSAPTGLEPIMITESVLEFKWTTVTGATGYKIFKNGNYLTTSTKDLISSTSLNPNTEYMFEVSAYNSTNESPKSNPLMIKTAPMPPTNLNASNITDSSFTLSWSPAEGATSYSVYQVDPGTSYRKLISTTNNPNYMVANLTLGSNYTFYIKSSNGNYSNYSTGLSVTTRLNDDTYEQNDTLNTASRISNGNSYESKISSSHRRTVIFCINAE